MREYRRLLLVVMNQVVTRVVDRSIVVEFEYIDNNENTMYRYVIVC